MRVRARVRVRVRVRVRARVRVRVRVRVQQEQPEERCGVVALEHRDVVILEGELIPRVNEEGVGGARVTEVMTQRGDAPETHIRGICEAYARHAVAAWGAWGC